MKRTLSLLLIFVIFLSNLNLPLAIANTNGTPTDWTSSLPYEFIKGIEIFTKEAGKADKLVFSNVPNT